MKKVALLCHFQKANNKQFDLVKMCKLKLSKFSYSSVVGCPNFFPYPGVDIIPVGVRVDVPLTNRKRSFEMDQLTEGYDISRVIS